MTADDDIVRGMSVHPQEGDGDADDDEKEKYSGDDDEEDDVEEEDEEAKYKEVCITHIFLLLLFVTAIGTLKNYYLSTNTHLNTDFCSVLGS